MGGYWELLEILSDPEHENYKHMRSWAGEDYDPELFDCKCVNALLPRQMVMNDGNAVVETGVETGSKPTGRSAVNSGRTYVADMTFFLDENGLSPIDAPK